MSRSLPILRMPKRTGSSEERSIGRAFAFLARLMREPATELFLIRHPDKRHLSHLLKQERMSPVCLHASTGSNVVWDVLFISREEQAPSTENETLLNWKEIISLAATLTIWCCHPVRQASMLSSVTAASFDEREPKRVAQQLSRDHDLRAGPSGFYTEPCSSGMVNSKEACTTV